MRGGHQADSGRATSGGQAAATGGPGLPGAAATWTYLSQRLDARDLADVRDFLASRATDLSRETYLYGLKRFLATGGTTLTGLTPAALSQWVTLVLSTGVMSRQTLRSTLTALRALASYLVATRVGYTSPFTGLRLRLPLVRDEDGVRVAHKMLSAANLRLVLERLTEEEVRAGHEVAGAFLFRFLAGTGMRVSEGLSLNHYDSRREGQAGYTNYLRRQPDGRWLVSVLGKAHRWREMQVGEELSTYLDERLPPARRQPDTPVFLTQDGRGRLGRHGAHRQAKTIARRFMQGLPGDMARRFGLHVLRHTLCNRLLVDLGVPAVHVARALGHSQATLARYYLHSTADVLRDVRLTS